MSSLRLALALTLLTGCVGEDKINETPDAGPSPDAAEAADTDVDIDLTEDPFCFFPGILAEARSIEIFLARDDEEGTCALDRACINFAPLDPLAGSTGSSQLLEEILRGEREPLVSASEEDVDALEIIVHNDTDCDSTAFPDFCGRAGIGGVADGVLEVLLTCDGIDCDDRADPPTCR